MKKMGIRCIMIGMLFLGLCMTGIQPVKASNNSEEAANLGNLDLSALFQRFAAGADGALSEGITYYMGEHFFNDPVTFIRTLAQESSEAQEKVIADFPHSMYYDMYPGGYTRFPETVASITLTQTDSDAARHILQCFQDAVSKYWGSNPKTGDPVGVAAALLAASGAGLAILPKTRKKKEK